MRQFILRPALAGLCLAAAVSLIAGCQSSQPQSLARAAAGTPQPHLPPSNYELADAGTVFVWRSLDTGEVTNEYVKEHAGRQMESNFGSRRSFGYVPDPWADNENTNEADLEPLFPLEVGKKVTFYRQPRDGRTFDTVEVVRTETLSLPFGTVDTYVIETTSKTTVGNWVGKATVWYAPSVRWQVQWQIEDNDRDRRRRQVIEIRNP